MNDFFNGKTPLKVSLTNSLIPSYLFITRYSAYGISSMKSGRPGLDFSGLNKCDLKGITASFQGKQRGKIPKIPYL